MRSKILFLAVVTLAVAATTVDAATTAAPVMGPAKKISRPAFQGYYDGDKVTYLLTIVSACGLNLG